MSEQETAKHILIVEDDELSLEVLGVLLESTGYRIDSAPTGNDALRCLAHPYPDVILTDLQMPGIRGNDLADRLRAICGPTTRLLAMSGSEVSRATVERYDGFLLKPFTHEDLDRALDASAAREPSQMEAPPLDPGGRFTLDERPALDEVIYSSLCRSMSPSQLAALYLLCIRDVRRRIERMRQHLSVREDLLFREEAHAIKGGCAMVGAIELQDIAAVMEKDGIQTGSANREDALLLQCLVAIQRLESLLKARPNDESLMALVE